MKSSLADYVCATEKSWVPGTKNIRVISLKVFEGWIGPGEKELRKLFECLSFYYVPCLCQGGWRCMYKLANSEQKNGLPTRLK
ncbi:hypothetical protein TNCT_527721 [Trichonephila clavata]|uniref:Uncharacterized protein n=1 Tax=Trichonephila clavata TaxID=2740835 RepID=A0A8X6GFN7_TRICU|nr:hypothetical protein TNCT_527721 [Trichonephila clavata]